MKYKVGDLVRLNVSENYGVRNGARGTIVEVDCPGGFDYRVNLDDINDVTTDDPDPDCYLFENEVELLVEEAIQETKELDILDWFKN